MKEIRTYKKTSYGKTLTVTKTFVRLKSTNLNNWNSYQQNTSYGKTLTLTETFGTFKS